MDNDDITVKPKRGRRPKYTPEEKKEKYLEQQKKYRADNADKVKNINKEYYKNHVDEYKARQYKYKNKVQNIDELLNKTTQDNLSNEDKEKLINDIKNIIVT